MSTPAVVNTQALCWDNLTSQGTSDRTLATVAPSPNSTSSDGKAQQSSVPNEVKSDKYPSMPLRTCDLRVASTVAISRRREGMDINRVGPLAFQGFGNYTLHRDDLP